ncbi:MAG TPA: hypothetical protein DD706_24805 [Nitrospiraceae bacterium]|nr:hypothetical protein [Nitrospiraceae bacterium]
MANKHLERWYIEQLRRAVPDFPRGTVQSDESPDFLVQSDRRRIGIEVTVFYWPALEGKRPHQEEQALKDRVVAVADKVHAEAGGPGLYVTVFFARPIFVTKRNVRERGEAIARAVLETVPPFSLNEPAVRVPWDRLPPGVTDITIRASVDGRDRLWSADAGGWVASVEPTHIQPVLERKTLMASHALMKCQELWLIIVNDEFSRGAPVELAKESGQVVYDHPFDRLFWLEPHRQRAWELWSSNRPLPPMSSEGGAG